MKIKIKIWLIPLQMLCCYHVFVGASLNCSNVNGNNFEQLSGTWESHFAHENGTLKYKLNLCAGLERQDACSGSSICRESDIESDTFVLASFGSFLSSPNITQNNQINVNRRSFYVEYEGGVCKTVNGSDINYRTSITFDCAKTLGVPQIVTADDCYVHFEWNSNVVCKSAEYDPVKEVKCYQFDSIGEMRDLNRLIKLTGGYFAENGETSEEKKLEIYFNVCRDIKTNPLDALKYHLPHTCPEGSAACLIKGGNTYSLGRPQDALTINDFDSLSIVYRPGVDDERMPDHCAANSTQVTIHFLCPVRGSSREPIVTGAEDCKYEITWWTEAACQDQVLSKTGVCKLEMATHGVDIDLSPLRNQTGSYDVPGLGSEYFKLNVCGATGSKCGHYNDTTHNAVCQYAVNNQDEGYIAGLMDDYKLEYFDGILLLTYSAGEVCGSNGFGRSSVIQFTCDKAAGDGKPVFVREEHCTYFFDWKTSRACTLNVDSICGAYDSNDNLIDLSGLTKQTDDNWEVNDGLDKKVDRPTFFINLCQPVIRKEAAIGCSPYSAVCKVQIGKSPVSFGNFLKSNITTTKDGEITVIYEGGDSCNEQGRQRSTRIHIFCAPGVTTEEPRIHYESADGCSLSILWYSSYACADDKFTGSQCMVVDSATGHTFDLRPLIATDTMYEISTYNHNYTLNVCEGLKGKRCGAGSSADVAICQSENQGRGREFVIGKASDTLTYFDGDLELLYDDGEAYNDGENHRSTQIKFICDKSAGKGQPLTIKEEDHTYWIDWKTSYACPPANEQCSVTDPHSADHYDLHALSRSVGNWIVVGDRLGSDKRRKYYLNICKGVNFVTLGNERIDDDMRNCSVETGMCETAIGGGMEHVSHPNGGRVANTSITVTSTGHVLLTYMNGEDCGDDGEHRSTNIHLICDENEHNSKPRFTSSVGCTTDFTWFTKHACPVHTIESTDSEECKIQVGDRVVDLKSLTRDVNDVYVVNSTDGSTYEMNICGGVHSCGDNNTVHACKRASNGQVEEKLPTLAGIEYTTEDNIQLRYTSTEKYEDGKLAAYVITFICDRGVTSHEMMTEEEGGDERRFVMRSSVVCPPQQFTCDDVTDKFGGVYDLRPITGKDVEVYNSLDPDVSFHLRLCGAVQEENCPSGNQVCMIDDKTSKGFGLGALQAAPRAQNNSIVMDYRSGQVCHNDTTRRYSATVTLVCTTRAGNPPVVVRTDDPCHYDFMWAVMSACAVNRTRGSGCVVTDPVYGMTFDLSALKSTTPYEIKTGGDWNYKLNVCDQIHCDGCGACGEGAAICRTSSTGTESSPLGQPNDQLTYDDGELYLKYNEGNKCGSGGETTSSKIRFLCSHEEKEPSFVEKSSDSCNYLFEYPTPLACPPMVSTMCSASDTNGEVFDLSLLQLSTADDDGNYLVDTSGDTGGKSFYINVCRSLVPHRGLACSPNAAACIKVVDANKTTSYISAGRIGGPPTYTDGHFELTYPNGDSCPHEVGNHNYTVKITFLCDDHTYTPLLVSDPNTCNININWRTNAVCPNSNQITSDGDCTAINPITETKYNLTSLSRANLTLNSFNTGKHFNLNICKPATGCPSGSGACEASKALSYGKASSNLDYSDGSLSLHYSNGDKCPSDSNRNLSTTINFVCHRSANLLMEAPQVAEEPTIISDDNCEANIVWRTFQACELQHSCTVADEHNLHVIDLSPLILEKNHYITYKNSNINYNSGVYFLSICRPLDAMPGVKCPPGAAVCEIGTGVQPQSRGHIDPRTPMMTYEDGKVNLRYESSVKCATNASVNISSRIIFTCDPDETVGDPIFAEVTSDCVHTFDWTTNVTCTESKPAVENKRCTYKSDVSDYIHDLSTYPSKTYENDIGKLELNPCDGSVESSSGVDDPCYNAAACLTSKKDGKRYSLGATGTHTYKRNPNDLKSFTALYAEGSECPDRGDGVKRQRSVNVYYDCSLNDEATTYFAASHDCEYVFVWPSHQFCAPTVERCEAYDVHNEEIYDFSPLSSTTHSWQVTDNDENRFWINLCRASQESDTSNKCPADSAVCLKQNDGSYHSFGKLATQTMLAESVDRVRIRYSGGDHSLSICDDGRMNASTIITMECDAKMFNPLVFDRLDSAACELHVTWKSQQACHKGGYRTATIDGKWQITDPQTNLVTDLSAIVDKTVVAEGDMREEDGPVRYNYLINLSGHPDGKVLSANIGGHEETCIDAAVCQFKPGKQFTRKVATTTSQPPRYIVDDGTVEIRFTSNNKCGRKPENNSYALVRLKCSQNDDVGVPVFMHESDDCGYFFTWDTKAACSIVGSGNMIADDTTAADPTSSSALSGGSIFFILLASFIVVGFTVTMIKKPDARHAVLNTCQLVPCCRRNNNPRYRYLRGETSDDDDASLLGDDDLLMEGAPLVNRGTNDTNFGGITTTSVSRAHNDEEDIFSLPDVKVYSGDGPTDRKGNSKRNNHQQPPPPTNPFADNDIDEFLMELDSPRTSHGEDPRRSYQS